MNSATLKVFLLFGLFFLNLTIIKTELIEDPPEPFNKAILNDTKSVKPTARTIYGLLGYLASFKLGQGSNPSTYTADTKENAHLNLFAKLHNGILHITYDKYPNSFQPAPYSPYSTYPSNTYSTHLQPPLWYPQLFIPQNGHNPVNQQQIINLHEPFNQNGVPDENYQELNGHNSQEINNNLDMPSPIEVFSPIKKFKPTNLTESKGKLCRFGNCVEAVESEPEENATSNYKDDPNLNSESQHFNSSDREPETTTIGTLDSDQSSSNLVESTVSHNVSTSDATYGYKENNTKPVGYPYAYYQYYNNASEYEHVSITELPLKPPSVFQKYPNFGEVQAYNRPYYYNHEDTFRPMGGSYYDNGYGYNTVLEEKFNKKEEESDFIPVDRTDHF